MTKKYFIDNSTAANLSSKITLEEPDTVETSGDGVDKTSDGLSLLLANKDFKLPEPNSDGWIPYITLSEENKYAVEIDGKMVPHLFEASELSDYFSIQGRKDITIVEQQLKIFCHSTSNQVTITPGILPDQGPYSIWINDTLIADDVVDSHTLTELGNNWNLWGIVVWTSINGDDDSINETTFVNNDTEYAMRVKIRPTDPTKNYDNSGETYADNDTIGVTDDGALTVCLNVFPTN